MLDVYVHLGRSNGADSAVPADSELWIWAVLKLLNKGDSETKVEAKVLISPRASCVVRARGHRSSSSDKSTIRLFILGTSRTLF
jgi:hypothetical protein